MNNLINQLWICFWIDLCLLLNSKNRLFWRFYRFIPFIRDLTPPDFTNDHKNFDAKSLKSRFFDDSEVFGVLVCFLFFEKYSLRVQNERKNSHLKLILISFDFKKICSGARFWSDVKICFWKKKVDKKFWKYSSKKKKILS